MAGNLLAKVVGLAAMGVAGYDTIASTQRQSNRYVQNQQLNRLNDVYMRTDSLDSDSTLANKLQNWARKWYMTDNWLFRMKDKFVSYIAGTANNAAENLTTFGLGALALFTGGGKGILGKIPVVGKLAAALLAVKAGKFILCDLFGVGAKDYRQNVYKA